MKTVWLFVILVLLAQVPTTAEAHRSSGSTAQVPVLAVVSEDPYSNPGTYHRTQVEPHAAAFGSTIVSVFQSGRSYNWGASNFGWSVSSDGGLTWTDGFLPGTTTHATPPGPWRRITDPAIGYDAKHDIWLIVGEGIRHLPCALAGTCTGARVFVSRSTDGARTFGQPILPRRPKSTQFFDVPWITCDNTASSPFYGNCYLIWVDGRHRSLLHAYTSSDGGQTWAAARIKGQHHCTDHPIPVIRPDGGVIIAFGVGCETYSKASLLSTNGGTSYSGPYLIPSFDGRAPAGNLRAGGTMLLSVDAAGKAYAARHDCGFRQHENGRYCTHNDIVLSTSVDGRHWTDMYRIPIDPVSSSADYFLPAIAVDPQTSGASAHIAIVYYFHPKQWCDEETCDLYVGLVSSVDGGSNWDVQTLAGPIKNTWFPLTNDGYMVGEYIGISFVQGRAVPIFPMAAEGACELGDITSCNVWTASATIPVG